MKWSNGRVAFLADSLPTAQVFPSPVFLPNLTAPRGVSTIDFDPETTTIEDLKVLIFSATEIPPSEQELKYSYPPKLLHDVQGPLSSIPITKGEQIIVTSVSPTSSSTSISSPSTSLPSKTPSATNSSSTGSSSRSRLAATPTPAPSIKAINETISAPSPLAPQPQPQRPESPLSHNDIPLETQDSVALPGRDAGYLQLRVVPDDNSCLFSAIGVIFEGGIEAAQKLRTVVADAIKEDPFTYSDVMLGQPADQYISKIQKADTWGGAIADLHLVASYKTEISSFDVATGRCDRFGQDHYDSRCILVYSGIHYDVVTLSPLPSAPPSFHTAVFPITDSTILSTAEKLVNQLKARHYYTDTANFDLRCQICGEGLIGEKGAREHATKTGRE
uniref:Ubiquitin thioesterase OTU n=1 Tax=Kwoniella dejecticola CBS 10117 TaxID=1296121 RepID=A0A1A6A2M1_9TREE|nr:ubiquitin thioesterase OTU1 [Kwoniella dejecticola CBS 10117]OBR84299.1 ubiquitin thioesterase OTU1 [Kwoniella dejecticola CBS 10117]